MAIPTVVVYVRHHKDCPHGTEKAGNNTGEFHRGCACKKWVRWHSSGVLHRQKADTTIWAEAEALAKRISTRLNPLADNTKRQPIDKAITLFLSDKRSQGIEEDGVKKYDRELNQMRMFFSKHGKTFVDEIDKQTLTGYREGWKEDYPSTQTRRKVQERLRAFLRFCNECAWLPVIPKLSAIKLSDPTIKPLDDDQYALLLKTALACFDAEKAKKVHALIQLMKHCGLAIRDTVTLERSEILHDDLYRVVTSRQKTGVHVSVPIPDDVAHEVLTVLNGNPKYIFWATGLGKETSAVTNWQHDLRTVFRLTFGQKTDFTPHCLRHTFAKNMLVSGAPMEEVARALGNSLKVCEKHYGQWVPARQKRLDTFVVASWPKSA